MLQKINQKYNKTPKVNTRDTHLYQLVHFSKHFWVAATCNSHWPLGTYNAFMVVMVYITCYCLSPFQHLQLQTSTWIQITCDITRAMYYRSSFECLYRENSVGILIFQKEEHGNYRSTFYFISKNEALLE